MFAVVLAGSATQRIQALLSVTFTASTCTGRAHSGMVVISKSSI